MNQLAVQIYILVSFFPITFSIIFWREIFHFKKRSYICSSAMTSNLNNLRSRHPTTSNNHQITDKKIIEGSKQLLHKAEETLLLLWNDLPEWRPIRSRNFRSLRPSLPSTGLTPFPCFPVLLHGILCLLSNHVRLLPAWLQANGRWARSIAVRFHGGGVFACRDNVCGTSDGCCRQEIFFF